MRTLPPDVEGPDNDLADLLDHYVKRAVADPAARLYVFGSRFGPEPAVKDKVFGFQPGNGVHDVHMNQGNSRRFRGDDGVWQDGALLLRFPRQSRWVGIFLAFQSQSWHTDDTTGHALEDVDGTRPAPSAQPVRIVAALVNPKGPAPEAETVTPPQRLPDPVDLTGWRVVGRTGSGAPVPAAASAGARCLSRRTAHRRGPTRQPGRRDLAARRGRPEGPRRLLHRRTGRPRGLDGGVLSGGSGYGRYTLPGSALPGASSCGTVTKT